MRKTLAFMGTTALVAAGTMGTAGLSVPSAQAATVTIACASVGAEMQMCRDGAEAFEAQSDHEVEIVTVPNDASERLGLYQQILAANSGDIDVFSMDIIWPGVLGDHFVDLSQHYSDDLFDDYFPEIVDANTVGGRVVGLPWYTDTSLLYYREDLLEAYDVEVPETYNELEEAARTIQEGEREENPDFHGFLFQGRAYEGLTVNALEWIYAHNGGRIVEPDGEITVNNENARQAVSKIADWVGEITPDGSLNHREEDTRGIFQSGNAAFLRNWPYVWGTLADAEGPVTQENVGIAPLPRGGEDGNHAHGLGGWNLAVSQYGDVEASVEFVRFMSSAERQKHHALNAGWLPTRPAIYDDPEVQEANPHWDLLRENLEEAVARPSAVAGERYNQLSSEFYNAVHNVLSGRSSAEEAFSNLERALQRLSRGGRW